MSRWTQDPPDDDRYTDKPVDAADAPQDGEPWNPDRATDCGGPWSETAGMTFNAGPYPIISPIDPAEHAASALIEALTTVEQELVSTQDLERARFLQTLIGRHATHAQAVEVKAWEAIGRIMERRR